MIQDINFLYNESIKNILFMGCKTATVLKNTWQNLNFQQLN